MRYVAAACLTALGGQEVNAENIEKILRCVLMIREFACYLALWIIILVFGIMIRD